MFHLTKKEKNTILLGVLLLAVSIAIFTLQQILFRNPTDAIFFLLEDLAFLPVEVFIVTVLFERFLNVQENRKQTKKINVVITTFFVEAGSKIMEGISKFNQNHEEIEDLIRGLDITKKNERVVNREMKGLHCRMHADPEKLKELHALILDKKSFVLDLLDNPNLLEHDSFTDMLWAVFHVADELQIRDLDHLNKIEIDHLSNDLCRAYTRLIKEWVHYIIYLESEYPFLHVAAIKKSLFLGDRAYGMQTNAASEQEAREARE